MDATGWSWPELSATPWELVAEKMEHVAAQRHWQTIRADRDRQLKK